MVRGLKECHRRKGCENKPIQSEREYLRLQDWKRITLVLHGFRDPWTEERSSVKVRKDFNKALPRQHRLVCVTKKSLLLKALTMRLSGHVLGLVQNRFFILE